MILRNVLDKMLAEMELTLCFPASFGGHNNKTQKIVKVGLAPRYKPDYPMHQVLHVTMLV